MQRYTVSALAVLAVMSAFWAYSIMDTLIREFSMDVTFIDLGAIFVLGLIAGIAVGLAVALSRRLSASR